MVLSSVSCRFLIFLAHVCTEEVLAEVALNGLRGFAYPMNHLPSQPSSGFLITCHEKDIVSRLSTAEASKFYVSTHLTTGEIGSLVGGFSFEDDAGTPGCNAAHDEARQVWYKTDILKTTMINASCLGPDRCDSGTFCCKDPSSAGGTGACYTKPCNQIDSGSGSGGGQILTIDVASGQVVSNVTMTGSPHHPPAFAWDAKTSLAYGVVPYEYTAYGIFSFNTTSGAVVELETFSKGSMDGIGDCVAGVMKSGNRNLMWYVLAVGHSASVVFFDLATKRECGRMPGFYMLAEDPAHSGTLLGLINTEPGVRLVRLDPLRNSTKVLYTQNNTTLGADMRCQDQASFAVNKHGSAVNIWFASSYNDKSGELQRGIFHLAIDEFDAVQLVSEKKFFGEPDHNITFIGKLDWFGDAAPGRSGANFVV